MADLDKLTMTHLQICYKLLSDPNSSFFLDGQLVQMNVDDWKYYLVHNTKEDDYRVLFPPVTLADNSEPSARSLESSLRFFLEESKQFKEVKIRRIVIPIGEISFPIFLLRKFRHMVTIIIDFAEGGIKTGTPVRVKIIDSYSFSLPGYHETESIFYIIGRFFAIFDYQREYLSHQSWLDLKSCCYFTLKVIHKALTDRVKFNGCDTQGFYFVQNIPSPNTWLMTSDNWLTLMNRREIKNNIMEHFRSIKIDQEECVDDIIEAD